FVQPSRQLGRWLSDGFDRGLERLVNGVGGLVREASLALRDVQTGYVRNYALMILGGAVLIVAYMLFGGM
ncbi:MAG: NADH-quinone oxidoreductase subunit L, partial [Thermomicrobiales bacterium]